MRPDGITGATRGRSTPLIPDADCQVGGVGHLGYQEAGLDVVAFLELARVQG